MPGGRSSIESSSTWSSIILCGIILLFITILSLGCAHNEYTKLLHDSNMAQGVFQKEEYVTMATYDTKEYSITTKTDDAVTE